MKEKLAGKILFVDSSQEPIILALFDNNDKVAEEIIEDKNLFSEQIFFTIDNLLKSVKISQNDLDGLAINCGPGSYTGLRIGISALNALSFALQIPIYSAKIEAKKLFVRKTKTDYVTPIYPQPPKITQQKKS